MEIVRFAVVCISVSCLLACGARTELYAAAERDAGIDARHDARDPQPPQPTRVFVTVGTYQGDFGGLAGADAICQKEADAANLGGKYLAWLSDSEGSPSTRFAKQQQVYVRVDGVIVASGWKGLTAGSLEAPINLTAAGALIPATDRAWTMTHTDGTPSVQCGNSCFCLDWSATYDTSSSTGLPYNTDAGWTDTGFYQDCGQFPDHLYCFEQ